MHFLVVQSNGVRFDADICLWYSISKQKCCEIGSKGMYVKLMCFHLKVLILSFLAAAVVVALTVLNFTILRDRNTVFQSVLTLAVGLMIPVIGWFGAKSSNRNMVGVFCAFSFSCGLFNLISYCVVMASIATVRSIIADCAPDGTVVINGEIDYTICTDYTDSMLTDMYIIATCITIPVILLQWAGSYFGNKLYETLTPGVVITYNASPYAGQGYTGHPVGRAGVVPVPYPVVIPAEAVIVHSPTKKSDYV